MIELMMKSKIASSYIFITDYNKGLAAINLNDGSMAWEGKAEKGTYPLKIDPDKKTLHTFPTKSNSYQEYDFRGNLIRSIDISSFSRNRVGYKSKIIITQNYVMVSTGNPENVVRIDRYRGGVSRAPSRRHFGSNNYYGLAESEGDGYFSAYYSGGRRVVIYETYTSGASSAIGYVDRINRVDDICTLGEIIYVVGPSGDGTYSRITCLSLSGSFKKSYNLPYLIYKIIPSSKLGGVICIGRGSVYVATGSQSGVAVKNLLPNSNAAVFTWGAYNTKNDQLLINNRKVGERDKFKVYNIYNRNIEHSSDISVGFDTNIKFFEVIE
ncbi:hypothetical protein [Kushneria aurantia]|uniref:Uncharacterized protein n=1 Tax=Kushneria aurantia TaxID=504092 RepID=A0ABV6G4K9_9GAMM|nr:hypothetical protein [Kushneria aurantia]